MSRAVHTRGVSEGGCRSLTGQIEIKTMKNFLAMDEACLAIFDIFQALKRAHLLGLDFKEMGS